MWPRARNSMLNKWIGITASIALVGLSGQLPAAAEDELPAGHYIVALPNAPVALHPSTKAAAGESVDVTSAAAVSRADALQRAQDRVLADVEAQPTSRYTTVLNGFAVELTAAEATELAARSDVTSLTPDTPRPLHTGESATSGRTAPMTDTHPR